MDVERSEAAIAKKQCAIQMTHLRFTLRAMIKAARSNGRDQTAMPARLRKAD
jgi:hypothetical protein